ncbi:hypothetical protein [Enterococcus mundtii]|uniref:Uncharacterized protein n=1 Tax=Enterococcus mundtii TaxID=53346 RepID=A0A1L8V4B8_ENTMU|nr:hypothetical protein [Enterococcus mundtii]OJG63533.1 hypothetical protein RV08_GL000172 [Enterococcus mundtii]OTP28280.1 hypothetical protein A5802_002020 [Enterococcus mundtii]GEL79436.1 hypothetical protein EMU01_05800 [Enterococcus mundtii]GEN16895.1 hypothetical protein LAC02_01760 [Ligilactobacillus acidipiscis]
MEKAKSLIIWNKDGSTMNFEKVTNFIEDWQRAKRILQLLN